ncbi:unnamed protein product [Bursaphelenchus xylophilus]|uniref:Queuosine 5'-phosphate N-glycosylase/hydrolase n=1 Tax=Bursaphelenchus xylophilus TaxID=6326 RepID=A0A1I7RLY9_BURXY|nr:unnamed protein product [Bursaphelenchus xylophilus]CAG9113363.1 unnamed protein product [Bursaphelenchus xylophilus]
MVENGLENEFTDDKWLQKVFHDDKEVLWPREAGEFVAKTTKIVKINNEKVDEVAKLIYDEAKKGALEKTEFHDHELHPNYEDPERTARWVFFVDTINFCFWYGHDGNVEYNGKNYSGYYFGAACLKRALDNYNIDVTDPNVMITLDEKKFGELFRGKLPIGLSALRARAVVEAGRVLLQKYDGKVLNLLKSANGSAQSLVKILVRDFKSYRDSCVYKGKRLMILKRAQIFTADVYSALKGNSKTNVANFRDIDSLTMFADYRVPQILCHLGVLEYSKQLQNILKRFSPIRKGSATETAIRAVSIHACDKLTKKVIELEKEHGKLSKPVTDADIDVFLWLKRREIAEEVEKTTSHHRVITWFY